MSTLTTSLVLILVGLAMFYPVFFYIIDRKLKRSKATRKYLQFNYLVHLLAGGISVLLFWVFNVNYPLQISGIVYLIVITVVVIYYWKSPISSRNLFAASVVFGIIIFYRTIKEIVEITPLWPGLLTGVLSAGAISLSIFIFIAIIKKAESHNLDSPFLWKMIKYLFTIIGARIAWGILILFTLSVETQNNEVVSALNFFLQVDQYKFMFLITFGLVIPTFFYSIFVKRLKTNESPINWRMFLVFFMSIVLTDFLYKYFLLQYGIVL